MWNFLKANKYVLLLWILILAYIAYFSYFSILRYKTLYASYYDLGIMHQTVFNTYKAISTGDYSRFLELTNPLNSEQIKRMAIHNDPLLALLAPFYFIHSGPETLLILQSIFSAIGAFALFNIGKEVFRKNKYVEAIAFVFAVSYLLYNPLQRANTFEFHAVVFATSGLLFMFYFWLVKRYWWSFVFFILSLLAKEQIALVTMMFGLYILILNLRVKKLKPKSINKIDLNFGILLIILSLIWFILSVFYIIPLFRGGHHFATERYSELGDSPAKAILNVVTNPLILSRYFFRLETWSYVINLLSPVGLLSLLAPLQLAMAVPEFAINILSQNGRMRYLIYHYTAVITPFVFISALYGMRNLLTLKNSKPGGLFKKLGDAGMTKLLIIYLLFFTLYLAYMKGPLPFAKGKNIHPFKYVAKEWRDTAFWGRTLKDENLKISTTGQLSPYFTSRRYFYTFSDRYKLADYVIVRLNEIYNYPEKNELIPQYEDLIQNQNYRLIYQRENFEVYKKIIND